MTEPMYTYGWGRTKHIRLEASKRPWERERTLCGVYGGNAPKPSLPICKSCARVAGQEVPSEAELLQLKADLARSVVALEKVRALHPRLSIESGYHAGDECCGHDGTPWPCATIRALDGSDD